MKRTRRQAFGQHFLKDQSAIQKIIDAVEIDIKKYEPRFLVELGPGHLALTLGLAELCSKYGIKLTLVERDRKLENYILENLNKKGCSYDLNFFDGVTESLPMLFRKLNLENHLGPGLFVSNLPYSASSQIIARLCESLDHIHSCVVMVQKELADRMKAEAGSRDRGSFSVLLESYFRTEKLFHVPPGAFSPPPKVMSTVLRLVPKRDSEVLKLPTPLDFQTFCKKIFGGKRKMIRNLVPELSLSEISEYGLQGTERPEELSLTHLLGLFQAVSATQDGVHRGKKS